MWTSQVVFSSLIRNLVSISLELTTFVESHKPMLERLNSVKIYYDCGQSIVTNMLHDVFGAVPLSRFVWI